ncbi:MAG: hypothetical protein H0T58_10105 [Gemmatimonadales bacterium]|nr:hypothetical protein [Gemmatimonadales bacterium]
MKSFTAYLNGSGEPGRGVDQIFFRVDGHQIIRELPQVAYRRFGYLRGATCSTTITAFLGVRSQANER